MLHTFGCVSVGLLGRKTNENLNKYAIYSGYKAFKSIYKWLFLCWKKKPEKEHAKRKRARERERKSVKSSEQTANEAGREDANERE